MGKNNQFHCKACHLVLLKLLEELGAKATQDDREFNGQRFEVKKNGKKKKGSSLFYTISLLECYYSDSDQELHHELESEEHKSLTTPKRSESAKILEAMMRSP